MSTQHASELFRPAAPVGALEFAEPAVHPEKLQSVHYESHSLEYLHMSPEEEAEARAIVEEIRDEPPMRNCRDLMLRSEDYFTLEHSERQQIIALVICGRLGRSREDKLLVARASFIEDVAKEFPGHQGLAASGKRFVDMEPAERAQNEASKRAHPIEAAQWVPSQPGWDPDTNRKVASMCGGHHWFPKDITQRYGLPPDPDVAYLTQILVVADLSDAMGSRRPYKPEIYSIELSRQKVQEQFGGPQEIIDAGYPTLAAAA